MLDENYYASQVIYNDLATGQPNLYFIRAVLSNEHNLPVQEKGKLFCKLFQEQKYITNYPLLVYTNTDANQTELMLVNLCKDQSQVKLMLQI